MRRIYASLLVLLSAGWTSGQTICLDPGHPSENGRGSRGKKLTEVRAAWTVALRVRDLLEAQGYQVVLTKSAENQKLANRERAAIANAAKADLFLRFHCDAANGSGIGVYYPAQSGRVGQIVGPSKAVREKSRLLAKRFHPTLVSALKGIHLDRGLKTDRQTAIGRRQGALTGSIFSTVPVLLIELAVLTNPRDEAFLTSKNGHERLCRALAKAVAKAVPRRSGSLR